MPSKHTDKSCRRCVPLSFLNTGKFHGSKCIRSIHEGTDVNQAVDNKNIIGKKTHFSILTMNSVWTLPYFINSAESSHFYISTVSYNNDFF